MSDKISTRNKTQKKCISFLTRQFGPREIDNLASNRKSCIKILEINKSIKNSGVLPLSFLQLEDSQERQHQHYIRCTMTVKHGSKMNSSNSFQQKHDFRTRLDFCVFGWLAWVFFIIVFVCLFDTQRRLCHICNWHQFSMVVFPDQTNVLQLTQNSDHCSYIPYLYSSCSNIYYRYLISAQKTINSNCLLLQRQDTPFPEAHRYNSQQGNPPRWS